MTSSTAGPRFRLLSTTSYTSPSLSLTMRNPSSTNRRIVRSNRPETRWGSGVAVLYYERAYRKKMLMAIEQFTIDMMGKQPTWKRSTFPAHLFISGDDRIIGYGKSVMSFALRCFIIAFWKADSFTSEGLRVSKSKSSCRCK